MNTPLFSILILSVPNRMDLLSKLFNKLISQTGGSKDIEILCLMDNKVMTIGEKRQNLLNISRGKWVGFLDDDDDVADSYIADIRTALTICPADVIVFNQHCMVNGEEFLVFFDLSNPHEPLSRGSDGKLRNIRRFPYHMCFWKSEVAKNTPFRNISYGEDRDWCQRMIQSGAIKTQTKIDKILHYYRFEDKKSESLRAAREQHFDGCES